MHHPVGWMQIRSMFLHTTNINRPLGLSGTESFRHLPHVPEPPVEVSINGLCGFFAQYPVKLYDSPDFPAISVLALPAGSNITYFILVVIIFFS